MGAEVPGRRADADGADAGDLLQGVRSALHQFAFGVDAEDAVAFVDPTVDADLVAGIHGFALLLWVEQRHDGGDEEGGWDLVLA